jgi:dihydroorotase
MLLTKINNFLTSKLKLTLHPYKVYIKTYNSGVDFLGWVHFNYHRQIRTTTKRKITRNLKWYPTKETINSYRGLLDHGNTYKFRKKLEIL